MNSIDHDFDSLYAHADLLDKMFLERKITKSQYNIGLTSLLAVEERLIEEQGRIGAMTPPDRTNIRVLDERLDALFLGGELTTIEYALRLNRLRALEDRLYKNKGENQ